VLDEGEEAVISQVEEGQEVLLGCFSNIVQPIGVGRGDSTPDEPV